MKKINEVLVVGGGIAGLLAAVNLKAKLPALSVRLLAHPPEDDFAPDAMATTPAFPQHIHHDLGLNPLVFLRAVGPVFTLGTRYEWGPRDFFDYTYEFQIDTRYAKLKRESGFYVGDGARAFENVGPASALMSSGKIFLRGADGRPQVSEGRFAYHVPHRPLLNLLVEMAKHARVEMIEGELAEARRGEDGISEVILKDGQVLKADLYVDATGLQSLLLGKTLESKFESFAPGLSCDRAVVGSFPRGQEPIAPNAFVATSEAGWIWRVDTLPTITCGHAYSSVHVDDQKAEAALRAKYPRCSATRILNFRQGRYEKAWVGNVVGVGNAAAFIEPLAAAGPAVLAFAGEWLAQTLVDCEQVVRPTLMKQFNKRWQRLVDGEREFLALFYKHNNRQEPFWSVSRENSQVGDLDKVAGLYSDLGPDSLHRHTVLHENDPFGLEAYFSLLVGQKVPWDLPYQPTAEELADWQAIQEAWRRKAATGVTVEEMLRMMLAAGAGPAQRPMSQAMQPVA